MTSRGRTGRPAVDREETEVQTAATPQLSSHVATVPNLLSLLRLAAIPVFWWLVMRGDDGPAATLLVVGAATDWLDGYLARRWDQVSRLGALLDPVVDRLWILAALLALGVRDVVPWWLVVAVVLRDALLWSVVPALRRRGYSALPVHFLGKAATASLLISFPLLLLAGEESTAERLAQVAGWAFAWWGLVTYWWAGVLYVHQVRALVRSTPPVPAR